jgi:hypothetical protein
MTFKNPIEIPESIKKLPWRSFQEAGTLHRPHLSAHLLETPPFHSEIAVTVGTTFVTL